MSRSLKKPLFVDEKLQKKVEQANQEKKKIYFKTWSRDSTITPEMIGHTAHIHNGRAWSIRQIIPEMVGCKLGEFAPTRKRGKHGKAGTR